MRLKELQKHMRSVSRNRLFGVLLFDSRPSHEGIQRFSKEHFNWLDELATASGIFFYVFSPSASDQANPGPEIAGDFGIGLTRLPGVLLFTQFSTGKFNSGAYLQLEAKLFEENLEEIETVFSELSLVIRKALMKTQRGPSGSEKDLMKELETKMAGLNRSRITRKLCKYAIEGLKPVKDLPQAFIRTVCEGLARGHLGAT